MTPTGYYRHNGPAGEQEWIEIRPLTADDIEMLVRIMAAHYQPQITLAQWLAAPAWPGYDRIVARRGNVKMPSAATFTADEPTPAEDAANAAHVTATTKPLRPTP
jgi:hypothetical protein